MPPNAPNQAPPNYVVNAGGNVDVLLDGSASFDPDAMPPCNLPVQLTYYWTITAEPFNSQAGWASGGGRGGGGLTTTLANPTLNLDRKGLYLVTLTVSDGTNTSSPKVIQINY